MFHMGIEELNDVRYWDALIQLTDNDIIRAKNLCSEAIYKEVLEEMLKQGVKLEQEIVSYTIMKS